MCETENSKEQVCQKDNTKDSMQEPLLLGTKKGTCPVCKEFKTLILLRYELVMCKSCLNNIAQILELAKNNVSKEELTLHFAADKEDSTGKKV